MCVVRWEYACKTRAGRKGYTWNMREVGDYASRWLGTRWVVGEAAPTPVCTCVNCLKPVATLVAVVVFLAVIYFYSGASSRKMRYVVCCQVLLCHVRLL